VSLPAPHRDDITGLLLAGGRGARMGGADKGLLLLDGEPLALRVLRRLRPQVGSVLISANRNADTYRTWAPVVGDADAAAFAGPLAGIAAAMQAMRTGWLAVAPCDLPHLPADAYSRLAAALDGGAAAFAAPSARSHSLVCLLHRSTLPSLDAALAGREARVSDWLRSVGARGLPFADEAAFANLNSPAELAASQARKESM
jgi:molybdopterin-guanine dinucleotide biosynthesis protein A